MKSSPLFALFAIAAAAVHAQTPPARHANVSAVPGMSNAKPARSAAMPMSRGEVLKVLPNAILIKHGPIVNLGMDAMTMQFGVSDTQLLKSIKVGDKVRFVADRASGKFVVTHIEVAK